MTEVTWKMYFTLAVLLLEVAAFATNKIRLDVTVLLGCYALVVAKVVTSKEALAGFGDSTTMMITSTFVLGMGIQKSGMADEIAMVLKKGTMGKQWLFVLELMVIAAGLSAFMSNTGTVAIMLPIVLSTIKECGWQKRPFLMALAFASSLGGCLTIIGTPPNMVVNDYLIESTGKGLSFFGFAPIGIVCLIIGVIYMLFVGKWILIMTTPKTISSRSNSDETVGDTMSLSAVNNIDSAAGTSQVKMMLGGKGEEEFADRSVAGSEDEAYVLVAVVVSGSKICGKRFCDIGLHSQYAVTVLATGSSSGDVASVDFGGRLEAGDRLYIRGGSGEIAKFETACAIDVDIISRTSAPEDAVLFRPRGTVVPSDFNAKKISLDVEQGAPSASDVYVISGKQAKEAGQSGEVLGAGFVSAMKQLKLTAYFAVLSMVFVVVFMFFEDIIPNVTVMMLGATLMCILGCMTAAEAYKSIHWESVVLIAGMIPMSTALQKTGAIAIVVDALGRLGTTTSPLVVLTVLFLIAAILTQVFALHTDLHHTSLFAFAYSPPIHYIDLMSSP
eukprot:comp24217_c0_seq2/m.44554 comp24217_c0_seq2/g.44554  ORF comp24217_c0_seq2/g.44554 comp24217_c0_seq2/m.44554 type:complete len:557 (-) comp24217_c0_seq2:43-1713(-)